MPTLGNGLKKQPSPHILYVLITGKPLNLTKFKSVNLCGRTLKLGQWEDIGKDTFAKLKWGAKSWQAKHVGFSHHCTTVCTVYRLWKMEVFTLTVGQHILDYCDCPFCALDYVWLVYIFMPNLVTAVCSPLSCCHCWTCNFFFSTEMHVPLGSYYPAR